MTSPRNQPQYQVRFDWGIDGGRAIAPGAQVLVWVDALPTASHPDPTEIEGPDAILAGTTGNSATVADWVLERQVALGDRVTVAVVAAGERGRFAVEDLLAAGAVIDALAEAGIDYLSPEAAAAAGAYTALRNATSHVLTASVTGQELIRDQRRAEVETARDANSQPLLRVFRESP